MATRRVSVEISNSAVRMAEVVIGGGRPELVSLGQVGLPPRAVVDGVILEMDTVRAALERCVKEGGFSAGNVYLGIAGLRCITRELEMPLVPDSEIDAAVRLQALDVIPFAIDKALISARALEETIGPNDVPERRVLIAAAHRDLVDPLVEIVTAAGLTPVSIEPTSSAMIRALFDPATATEGPEAIISVGAGLTTVAVHENGVPHFVRTIAEGGDAVTSAIAGALDLPVADAEVTKRNLDQSAPHIRVAMTAAREASMSLIGELRSSIDYYATLTGRSPVRRVVVTGGGSRLSGFVEQLQQQLRLPVLPGSALDRIDCSRLKLPTEEIERLDSSVAVVVGLALPGLKGIKELDLLPPEVQLGRRRKRIERAFILVGIVLIAGMVGLGVLRFFKVHNAENQVTSLNGQISGLKAQIPEYSKVQQERAAIIAFSNISNPIVQHEVYWPGVLSALQSATPKGGTITSFSGTSVPQITAAPTTGGAAPPPLPPSAIQIASLAIGLVSPTGYTYFHNWYFSVTGSGKLTVNQYSGISKSGTRSVTFTASVGVTAEVRSIRINEFKVPS
jgi:type IV pilus assembly protein PilM